ncbi:hypothetical protein HBN50_11250 [Halobacteriovorax sp. GB3]|uniref:hypothetical protein n=1 Tax=Halobacteriovorax sp. GB3 TaxID=2719615 RepID=UPI002360374C|nr:hypothetical protein [Halobacteriovorax sp. GB3]MDD0853676.1 hypothetical protein [Halobacteriovorax sp. GB3]
MMPSFKVTILALSLSVFSTASFAQNKEELRLQQLIFDTQTLIPTIQEIDGSFNKKIQTIPYEYFQVAENLREMDKIARNDFSKREAVLAFEKRCSLNKKVITIIKALCLTHYLQNIPKEKRKAESKEYSAEIINLTRLIIEES